MRMKQREDAKHERRNGIPSQSFPIIAALRAADFHRVWLPEPAAADRPREIHRVVAFPLSFDRRGNWMGDVSVLTLKERHFRGWTDTNLPRMSLRAPQDNFPSMEHWLTITPTPTRYVFISVHSKGS